MNPRNAPSTPDRVAPISSDCRLAMTSSHNHTMFHWDDPMLLDRQLTAEERQVRDAAATYCQERLVPRVLEAFRNERTDPAIFREMGELGLLGATIPEAYGGAALNYVCYGFVAGGGGRVGFRVRPRVGGERVA